MQHWSIIMKRLCFSQTLTVFLSVLVLSIPLHDAHASEALVETPKTVFFPAQQQYKPKNDVLAEMARANVVYLGEVHDRPQDHQAQLDILRSLFQQHPQLVIGMEMFQRPFQTVVDRYISRQISEQQFIEQTEYTQRWGFSWSMYAPILRFAQQNHISVIALNSPSEVIRKVARAGLKDLTPSEQKWIPPKSAIFMGPKSYQERMRQIYAEMHQGKGHSSGFERFFLAQVVWDETMAESIAQTIQKKPDALVVVLVGQGHILYGEGIPDRVARRLNPHRPQPLKQLTVVLNPSDDMKAEPAIADYFWYSP